MSAEATPPRAAESPRLRALCEASPEHAKLVQHMLSVSKRGLARMLRAEDKLFVHTLRRDASGGIEAQGTSLRYGAIVALGSKWLPDDEQRAIFAGETAAEFGAHIARQALASDDPGDVAIAAWATAELEDPRALDVLARARSLLAAGPPVFTVELAWLLSAACACDDRALAQSVRDRLLAAFPAKAGIFPHRIGRGAEKQLRAHVSCFADQVYPIQALSRFHKCMGDEASLAVAARCAEQICRLQGEAGQWWWHYDARTGDVVEGSPVYSVHQDAMGPMALLDLADAGGPLFARAIQRSLDWMRHAPEVGQSLIDDDENVIWRKVGRGDPLKLVRALRAVVTRIRPGSAVGSFDRLFPANVIDFESRPYHLGWVIHTWLGGI